MFQKRTGSLFIMSCLVAASTLLGGCFGSSDEGSDAASSGQKRAFAHDWGETLVQGTPVKVVALDFSFVDTMTALGVTPVGVAGVGQTQVPEYVADRVKGFTNVGERKNPNLELIRSVDPDLIIASTDRHEMIKNELKDIAPTIALSDDSYQEIIANTKLLGDVFHKEAEAEKVKQDLEAKIARAKSTLNESDTVLIGGAFEDDFSVWVKDSFVGSLLSDTGVQYVYDGPSGNYEGKGEVAQLSMERLAEINPDYLFLYGDYAKWQDNPLFKNLKASKQDHVLIVDRNLWSRGRGPLAAGLILDHAFQVMSDK